MIFCKPVAARPFAKSTATRSQSGCYARPRELRADRSVWAAQTSKKTSLRIPMQVPIDLRALSLL